MAYTLTDGTTRTAGDVQLASGHTLDDTGAPRTVSLQSDLSHVSYVTTVVHDAASGSDIGQIDLSQSTQGLVMDLNETSLMTPFFDEHGVPVRSVVGSAGDDVLLAGQGSRLTGGAGSDLFELSRASGRIAITDLLQGVDHIFFGAGQIGDFAALRTHAVQVGNDLEIQVGAHTSLTLQNIQLDHLNAGSFLFA